MVDSKNLQDRLNISLDIVNWWKLARFVTHHYGDGWLVKTYTSSYTSRKRDKWVVASYIAVCVIVWLLRLFPKKSLQYSRILNEFSVFCSFFVYLTTLSHIYRLCSIEGNEYGWCRRKHGMAWPIWRCSSRISLVGLRKTMKHIKRNNRTPGRWPNPVRFEYEVVLTAQPWLSSQILWKYE